ncbi:MAG: hypothetical protein QGF28_01865 [Candidatus Thalassarchaeaceae archaeon]|nr:hypothetical protein [Candidatus Thalassarchaeaceae archaeon]MDP7257601.1 hypothetical protein [Candidatus Thalassarchaeaceae archaeon]MDP7445939.1 hypothetical protein [Candidatus Thalassarchaeaceae archaeon]MDP7648913.1 hypothetical protein [Candidatus Thalassarchaeaceae archaeon]HJL55260.1 hypothetical protein [Candidatus Thalassarchaeaceae archaeon]
MRSESESSHPGAKAFQPPDSGDGVVKSFEITKVYIRDRLVVDANVCMYSPQDFDFSPRVNLEGNTLSLSNEGDADSSSFDLDSEQMATVEKDRMMELRVKLTVQGMHGTLIHKTPKPRSGPNAKKLAEPRWKTLLPIVP